MSKLGQRDQRLQADSTKRDTAFFRERARERSVAAEKTARLRALRMAKEATEREAASLAAAQAAADKAASPKRRKKAVIVEAAPAMAEG